MRHYNDVPSKAIDIWIFASMFSLGAKFGRNSRRGKIDDPTETLNSATTILHAAMSS